MGFKKARKEAFKRSLMSDKDKRRLEYKELAKESKTKNNMMAASQGKGLVTKIAINIALGNVISNAISKVGGGLLGFTKKSVEETSKTNRKKLLNSAFFTKEERDKIMGTKGKRGILGGMRGFERDLEKEEFLHQEGVFKGTLRDLDKLSTDNLKKAIEFSAMLKSSVTMSSEDTVKAVNSLLSGEGYELFDLLKRSGVGDKYIESAKKAWQSGAEVDLGPRITKMIEMMNDFKTLGITTKADTKEEIDSNLASAEQTPSNLANTVLNPLLKFIQMVTDYLNGFTFQTHVIEPFFKGLKILFAILPLVGQFFRDDL